MVVSVHNGRGRLGDRRKFFAARWEHLQPSQAESLLFKFLAVAGVDADVQGGALRPGDLKSRIARGLADHFSKHRISAALAGKENAATVPEPKCHCARARSRPAARRLFSPRCGSMRKLFEREVI